MENNKVIPLQTRNGTPVPLRVIKERDNIVADKNLNQDKRRSVTLDEQRIYNQLDEITAKLETVIRLEEKVNNLEGRVSTLGNDVDLLNREKQSVQFRLQYLENMKDQVEGMIRQNQIKYESLNHTQHDLKTSHSSIKVIVNMGIGIIKWFAAIILAAGLWNGLFKDNSKIDKPDKPQSEEIK